MKTADFVSVLYPQARAICQPSGISTVGCLAQCALESAWGERHPDGVYFGIKKWRKGQAVTAQPTYEVVNGQRVNVTAGFAKDDADGDGEVSFAEAVGGYVDFIKGNPRYHEALKYPNDWRSYIYEIAAAGYATDPLYRQKLLDVGNRIEKELYKQGLMK